MSLEIGIKEVLTVGRDGPQQQEHQRAPQLHRICGTCPRARVI
jgi:hypothetical protein